MLDFIPHFIIDMKHLASESSDDEALRQKCCASGRQVLSFEYEQDFTDFIDEMVSLAKNNTLKPANVIDSKIFQSSYESTVAAIQKDLNEIVKKSTSNTRNSFSLAARKFVKLKTPKEYLIFSGKVEELSPSDITIFAVQIFWRGFSSLEKCTLFTQLSKNCSEEDLGKKVNDIYRSMATGSLVSRKDFNGFFQEKSIMMFEIHRYNGDQLFELGNFQKARENLNKALLSMEGVFKNDAKEVGELHDNLGWIFCLMEEWEEAYSHLKQVEPIYETAFVKEQGKIAMLYNRLGCVLYYLKEYEEAGGYFSKALPMYEEVFAKDQIKLGLLYHSLALNYFRLKRYKEAAEMFEKVFSNYKKIFPKDSAKWGELHNNFGGALLKLGEYEKALVHFETVLAMSQKSLLDEMKEAATHRNMAIALKRLNRLEEAAQHLEQVLVIYKGRYSSHAKVVISVETQLLELRRMPMDTLIE